eukprot:scaffold105480_cov45-Phaeocystis_antarctica.AAC.1
MRGGGVAREVGGGGRSRCTQGAGERARLQIWGRARGGVHEEHELHGRDAGGVEAQRLVERRRVLPRVERRAYDAGRGIRTGRRKRAGDGGARSVVQGRARLQIGGRPRGGAHSEHPVHPCDAGGVEAQRLVERLRDLPRVERRAYGAGRRAGREAEGGGRPRCTQRAGERARLQIWGRARGGAHVEHVAHVRDAGGVEAQRLVERRRALPRVERRACGAGR